MQQVWIESDQRLLKELWPTKLPIKDIRAELSSERSHRSIRSQAIYLGVSRGFVGQTKHPVSEFMLVLIRDHWMRQTRTQQIADMCSISKRKLKLLAKDLGLPKRMWVIPNNGERGWPQDMADVLREGWFRGLSAGVIAVKLTKEFGTPVSRNAVIGKMSRLQLGQHTVVAKVPQGEGYRAARKKKSPLVLVVGIGIDGDRVRPFNPLPFVSGSCQYPVGSNVLDDNYYCGQPRSRGSYCAEHARLCFRSVAKKSKSDSGFYNPR